MRTLLLFAALVAVFYAKSFTMTTRTAGSTRAKLIADGTHSQYLEDRYRSRAEVLMTGSQPFMDYYDDFYYGNITIGSPPQAMTVALDTGSANLLLVSSACSTLECQGKSKFDPKKSSTYSDLNQKSEFGSSLGTDVFRFGGLTAQKQEFGLVSNIPSGSFPQAFDGVFGLGWPALAVDSVVPPMQNVLNQLDKPLFTVWMDRKLTPAKGEVAGLITYGAIDTVNCASQINYVPLSSETYWQFPISGFSIGSYSETAKDQVISDTGTSYIGCPRTVLQHIVQQTGATFDRKHQLYIVDCAKQNSLPDLIFTINGIKYNVPSVEYVVDEGMNNGKCAITFFATVSGGFGPTWVLGDTWIRTYCQIYDIGGKQIGFAKANHNL